MLCEHALHLRWVGRDDPVSGAARALPLAATIAKACASSGYFRRVLAISDHFLIHFHSSLVCGRLVCCSHQSTCNMQVNQQFSSDWMKSQQYTVPPLLEAGVSRNLFVALTPGFSLDAPTRLRAYIGTWFLRFSEYILAAFSRGWAMCVWAICV
jgi:hypothetical protein